MAKRFVYTDSYGKELGSPLDGDFPFNIEKQNFSDFHQNYFACHWHPELEITRIVAGCCEYQTNETTHLLMPGDGIFINANTLHSGFSKNDSDCTVEVIRVFPELLGGTVNSRIYKRYIDPILYCKALPFLPLCQDVPWHLAIVKIIEAIGVCCEKAEPTYELEALSLLLEIIQILYQNNQSRLTMTSNGSIAIERLRAALAFIQENYWQKLTLKSIADAAAISKSECCRLFNRILRQSPIDYLINYRIQKSLVLIANTSYSMTEIAQLNGFSGSSYFAEIFKQKIGCTPTAYRKKILHINTQLPGFSHSDR